MSQIHLERIRCLKTTLVVGGGIGGMAAAIGLARRGVSVEIIDIDPDWRVYGAGITITGPTLRAYRHLDLLEQIKETGAITSTTRMRLFNGEILRVLEEPVIEEGLPATGGIMRPALHRIMQDAIRALNIPVRLGVTVSSLQENEHNVAVQFSDGSTRTYELVIGSDSIQSKVRDLKFPHMTKAKPTGQGCWRVSTRKPPALDTGEFYLGSDNPCGITICGDDQVYLFLLTPHVQRERHMDGTELFEGIKEHLKPFGANAGWIRDNITPADWINYRPLAAVIQPKPWYNGRVVLLGDAVHATTPHLASGAGMAVESGIVLAEELAQTGDVSAALMAYQQRRFERCRDVVETSIEIGRLQLEHGRPEQIGGMIESALQRLNQPY